MKNNRDNIIAVLVGGKSFSPNFEKKVCTTNAARYIDDSLTGEELFTCTILSVSRWNSVQERHTRQGVKLSDNGVKFAKKMDEQRQLWAIKLIAWRLGRS